MNWIYVFINIDICDLFFFYGNYILVFDLLRRVTDIRIFRFESTRIIESKFMNNLSSSICKQ